MDGQNFDLQPTNLALITHNLSLSLELNYQLPFLILAVDEQLTLKWHSYWRYPAGSWKSNNREENNWLDK